MNFYEDTGKNPQKPMPILTPGFKFKFSKPGNNTLQDSLQHQKGDPEILSPGFGVCLYKPVNPVLMSLLGILNFQYYTKVFYI